MTGHGNTGYAGYFKNTDTSTTSGNFGVYRIALSNTITSAGTYGECDPANCSGVWDNSSSGTGVYGLGSVAGVWAAPRRRSIATSRPHEPRIPQAFDYDRLS